MSDSYLEIIDNEKKKDVNDFIRENLKTKKDFIKCLEERVKRDIDDGSCLIFENYNKLGTDRYFLCKINEILKTLDGYADNAEFYEIVQSLSSSLLLFVSKYIPEIKDIIFNMLSHSVLYYDWLEVFPEDIDKVLDRFENIYSVFNLGNVKPKFSRECLGKSLECIDIIEKEGDDCFFEFLMLLSKFPEERKKFIKCVNSLNKIKMWLVFFPADKREILDNLKRTSDVMKWLIDFPEDKIYFIDFFKKYSVKI